MVQAYLALEDGTVFQGEAFGSTGIRDGEVVFNTSMAGYQELLTDPSYCGQILVLTYPLVGNSGINRDDFQSEGPWVRGFVVKESCDYPSNWRNRMKLEDFCRKYGLIGLSGIDTRALTRRLRDHGTMRGILATGEQDSLALVQEAQKAASDQDLVRAVSTKEVQSFGEGSCKLVIIDLGVTSDLISFFVQRNCTVYLVPAWFTAEQILDFRPQGVVLSNGPGDPKDAMYAVRTASRLISKVALLGVGLGHQILGLALGGDTYKLKFGHRGSNQPVQDLETGRVYITCQNHGYAVAEDTLPIEEVVVCHRNLNDCTVEGIRHRSLPVFSYQFYPMGSPGIPETTHLFEHFIASI